MLKLEVQYNFPSASADIFDSKITKRLKQFRSNCLKHFIYRMSHPTNSLLQLDMELWFLSGGD